MKIIVGLGNPGPRYRNTRHNVGFRAVERVAERLGAEFSRERDHALIAETRQGSGKIMLLKPLTFMNMSGVAVAAAARNRVREPGDLMVLADDVNLPLGRLRFRIRGSAGGHNGLKSIIEHLGTDGFPRLRMGVGKETQGSALVEHVLGTFLPEEWPEVDRMIDRAVEGVLCYLASGIEAAMNEYNPGIERSPGPPSGERTPEAGA